MQIADVQAQVWPMLFNIIITQNSGGFLAV